MRAASEDAAVDSRGGQQAYQTYQVQNQLPLQGEAPQDRLVLERPAPNRR